MKYAGSCHCGKISCEVEAEQLPDEVVGCNCSICQRRGHLLWFLPRAQLQLNMPETDMSFYTFNKHHIKHYFCPVCGCAPFGMGSDGKGNEMAAINVRCLEAVDIASLKIKMFDGRSL
ncbi:MAG: GFA family protein [Gammaproteobacteria bacterium]